MRADPHVTADFNAVADHRHRTDRARAARSPRCSPITASGPTSAVGSMRADGGDDRGGMDAGSDRGRRVEQRRHPRPRDQRIGGDDRHGGSRHLVLHVRMHDHRRRLAWPPASAGICGCSGRKLTLLPSGSRQRCDADAASDGAAGPRPVPLDCRPHPPPPRGCAARPAERSGDRPPTPSGPTERCRAGRHG